MKVGLSGLVFIVFLVLKLTGIIAWSWLWVTAPLWIPFAIVLVLAALGGLASFLAWKFSTPKQRNQRKAAKAINKYGRSFSK